VAATAPTPAAPTITPAPTRITIAPAVPVPIRVGIHIRPTINHPGRVIIGGRRLDIYCRRRNCWRRDGIAWGRRRSRRLDGRSRCVGRCWRRSAVSRWGVSRCRSRRINWVGIGRVNVGRRISTGDRRAHRGAYGQSARHSGGNGPGPPRQGIGRSESCHCQRERGNRCCSRKIFHINLLHKIWFSLPPIGWTAPTVQPFTPQGNLLGVAVRELSSCHMPIRGRWRDLASRVSEGAMNTAGGFYVVFRWIWHIFVCGEVPDFQ